jgi:hypothetical protein
VPGRVRAALTKPGHASTARWCGFGERDEEEYGFGERDEEEYARNQRYYVP